jgi:hypothetical protein
VVGRVLAEPCEPHGRMLLDNYSIKHPDNRKPDEARLV